MKSRRLTRDESRQLTRARLIDAAGRVFARAGFEAASVEDISEEAGYSRGAFYSNIDSKDAIFLELLDRRRIEIKNALDEMLGRTTDIEERFRAAREWFIDRSEERQWTILKTELHLRALRSREIRKRLKVLLRQELESYSALLGRYFSDAGIRPTEKPETVALSLLAVSQGLGVLSLVGSGLTDGRTVKESLSLAFDRLIATAAAES